MSLCSRRTPGETAEAVAWAAAEGDSLEIVAGGTQARARAADEDRSSFSTCRGLTGIVAYEPAELVLTARPGEPLAAIERRARRRSGRCWRSSRRTGARFSAREGEPTLGGVDRLQPRRAAARARGLGARLRPRLFRRERLRRDLEGRRQGGQERHRLRHVQAAGGRLRHAVGADRGHAQGDAEAGDGLHPRAAMGSADEAAIRDAGARRSTRRSRSPARRICRPPPRAARGRRRCRPGLGAATRPAPRRPAAVGRLSRRRARGADRARARGSSERRRKLSGRRSAPSGRFSTAGARIVWRLCPTPSRGAVGRRRRSCRRCLRRNSSSTGAADWSGSASMPAKRAPDGGAAIVRARGQDRRADMRR